MARRQQPIPQAPPSSLGVGSRVVEAIAERTLHSPSHREDPLAARLDPTSRRGRSSCSSRPILGTRTIRGTHGADSAVRDLHVHGDVGVCSYPEPRSLREAKPSSGLVKKEYQIPSKPSEPIALSTSRRRANIYSRTRSHTAAEDQGECPSRDRHSSSVSNRLRRRQGSRT